MGKNEDNQTGSLDIGTPPAQQPKEKKESSSGQKVSVNHFLANSRKVKQKGGPYAESGFRRHVQVNKIPAQTMDEWDKIFFGWLNEPTKDSAALAADAQKKAADDKRKNR